MLSYMVYSGMPSHYPHWSYGKGFEKLKTLYDYGVSGLPYEMVINSNPSIAYLMRDNTLALQVLTIAHVYGHNDFFKNNFTFRSTRAEYTIETFKSHANRVRHYVEDPSIGLEKCRGDSRRRPRAVAPMPAQSGDQKAHRRRRTATQDRRSQSAGRPVPRRSTAGARPSSPICTKVPLYPDEDLLLFIRDHNPLLTEWEKDLLTIVHEEAQYFIPQIETKIMNEGWASFWHKRILETLDLPQELHLEFIVRHAQVLRPSPGSLNPYHVGMKIWEDIEKRWQNPSAADEKEFGPRRKSANEKLFEAREVERDSSFLRRYLTEDLIRELNLFEYKARGNEQVVSHVADEDNWQFIKDTLIRNVGTGTIPVIKVVDSDYQNNRTLLLKHDHDGRDLQLEYAEKTLQYVQQLWGQDVAMETVLDNQRTLLTFSGNKLAIRKSA